MSLLLSTHGHFPKVVAVCNELGRDVSGHLLPGYVSPNGLAIENSAGTCRTYQDSYRVVDRWGSRSLISTSEPERTDTDTNPIF